MLGEERNNKLTNNVLGKNGYEQKAHSPFNRLCELKKKISSHDHRAIANSFENFIKGLTVYRRNFAQQR